MIGSPEERRFFEACKAELMRSFPGHFAVICGRRLLGVYPALDRALAALAEGFEACNIPDGVPIFISQIADEVAVRVVAKTGRRAAGPPEAVTGSR